MPPKKNKKAVEPEVLMTSDEYRSMIRNICEACEQNKITKAQRDATLVKEYKKRIPIYRKGGEGFVQWAEENIRLMCQAPDQDAKVPTFMGELSKVPDPITGRTWWDLWCYQKNICREALALDDHGRLKHMIIVMVDLRGEGKSAMAVWMQGWKFFNFPDQKIFLCANSKDQSTYAHYDELTAYIKESPTLLAMIGGEDRLLAKQLAIRDEKKQVVSFIRSSSSYNGVMSNCSGFTFSEFFQAPMPTLFFSDISTSMRNVPNALGVIDSTVSPKDHTLYQLYEIKNEKKEGHEQIFFHYRCNPGADWRNFHNPLNNEKQLAMFKATNAHIPGKFEMFFEGLWSSAATGMFTDIDIKATRYLGLDGNIGQKKQVAEILQMCQDNIDKDEKMSQKGIDHIQRPASRANKDLLSRLIPISQFAQAFDEGDPKQQYVSATQLSVLGDFFDTNWCIGVGADRADPLSTSSEAQTVITVVAKGLPGSKSNPTKFMQGLTEKTHSSDFIHIPLGVQVMDREARTKELQEIISLWHEEYEDIETMSSDRYNISDLVGWLTDNDIVEKPEILHFSYDRQKEVFRILSEAMREGLLKIPPLSYPSIGGTWDNLLEEQFAHFNHVFVSGSKGKYGSDQKTKSGGVQDDALESLAMAIWGMRNLGLKDMREIHGMKFFGAYFDENGVQRA